MTRRPGPRRRGRKTCPESVRPRAWPVEEDRPPERPGSGPLVALSPPGPAGPPTRAPNQAPARPAPHPPAGAPSRALAVVVAPARAQRHRDEIPTRLRRRRIHDSGGGPRDLAPGRRQEAGLRAGLRGRPVLLPPGAAIAARTTPRPSRGAANAPLPRPRVPLRLRPPPAARRLSGGALRPTTLASVRACVRGDLTPSARARLRPPQPRFLAAEVPRLLCRGSPPPCWCLLPGAVLPQGLWAVVAGSLEISETPDPRSGPRPPSRWILRRVPACTWGPAERGI